MALCHECLKLVMDLIACRLLFREFLLQPVYAIEARTDLAIGKSCTSALVDGQGAAFSIDFSSRWRAIPITNT
jgi:hypothetical protein